MCVMERLDMMLYLIICRGKGGWLVSMCVYDRFVFLMSSYVLHKGKMRRDRVPRPSSLLTR